MPAEAASGMWRSEDMVCLDLVLQRETVHDTVYFIGRTGKAQFVDMNKNVTAFQRPFTSDIRRCDDLERKLSILSEELSKEGIEEKLRSTICALGRGGIGTPSESDIELVLQPGQLETTEESVTTLLSEVMALNGSIEGILREVNHHTELISLYYSLHDLVSVSARHGLRERYSINSGTGSPISVVSGSGGGVGTGRGWLDTLSRIPNILGKIPSDKSEMLYRIAYRTTRGNAVVEISNEPETLVDPKTGLDGTPKLSFAVLCTAPGAIERLRKLLAGLGATLYTLDEVTQQAMDPADYPAQSSSAAVNQLQLTLERTKARKVDLLMGYYAQHHRNMCFVRTEKAILNTMNLFTYSGSTSSATMWIPQRCKTLIGDALHRGMRSSHGDVEPIMSVSPMQKDPPTYFPTNKFTECFQGIVDSYGMARYKEVNPGVFTIVTFPYLFGVMYGDIGHGVILTLIAVYFIAMERAWKGTQLNEIVAMLFGGRYLLLLMGLFAIYVGVLYNDFFGFSIGLFQSGYEWPDLYNESGGVNTGIMYPIERGQTSRGTRDIRPNSVYRMGIDVAWAETENKLEFYNSVKMKCAVVIGVVQMLIGTVLSLLNHLHAKDYRKVVFLFIPEFVFLFCTFGYMAIIIVVKWCTTWEDTGEAPSILETMTNFFLAPGTVSDPPLYTGQAKTQVALLLTAVSMTPLMLIAMPYLELREHRQKMRLRGTVVSMRPQSLTPVSHSLATLGTTSTDGAVWKSSDSFGKGVGGIASDHGATFSREGAGSGTMHRDQRALNTATVFIEEEEEADSDLDHFDFSEVMIHYTIHTIEYVLGCVSNTASYLRLWALSLAHAQLSEVFLTFAIVGVLSSDTNGIMIAIGAAAWLQATLGVLVGMEALSAFLHALRLHWVEFNGKFYKGDGIRFEPLELLH